MNPFVADPEWGWWIVFYFYLGGIAAGSYFVATLIELIGSDEDRPLATIGYRVAFPLIGVCGILLIVDLDRPDANRLASSAASGSRTASSSRTSRAWPSAVSVTSATARRSCRAAFSC